MIPGPTMIQCSLPPAPSRPPGSPACGSRSRPSTRCMGRRISTTSAGDLNSPAPCQCTRSKFRKDIVVRAEPLVTPLHRATLWTGRALSDLLWRQTFWSRKLARCINTRRRTAPRLGRAPRRSLRRREATRERSRRCRWSGGRSCSPRRARCSIPHSALGCGLVGLSTGLLRRSRGR